MNFKKILSISVIFLSFSVHSENVSRIINKFRADPSPRSVAVLFRYESYSDYWLEKVKKLMRTQDDLAFLNPYWIIQFSDESIESRNQCGVVIGRWYTSGYMHKERWEAILENGLTKINYVILYVNSEGKLTSPDPAAANRLIQQCG